MRSDKVGRVDFPTLGDLADSWIERHCMIPTGFQRRQAFRQYDWQFWCTANHLRVREDAVYEDPAFPPLGRAFVYRRSDVVAAQKLGKGPWAAVLLALMGAGPSEFCGWAKAGDYYSCADNGCPCGWEFDYEPGEPMGMRHPSPLLQVLASSQDQVKNIWRPLAGMVRLQGSRLAPMMADHVDFIRIRQPQEDGAPDFDQDRIDAVTSSARSRLGNPITGYVQDETGTYTESNGMHDAANTMRRGAAGMNARGFTTTNCWDSSEQSTAQLDYEADAADVFSFWAPPPKKLDFYDDAERRLILEHNYAGSAHINIDAIDAEAQDLIAKGKGPEAERFFGNRVVDIGGAWVLEDLWEAAYAEVDAVAAAAG